MNLIYGPLAWLIRIMLKLSCIGFKRGPHITRFAMYERFKDFRCLKPEGLKVLSISHSEPLCRMLGFQDNQITDASYPEINVLSLPYADATFDYVVSDQVMEHVEGQPADAFNECFRVLKPGGMAVHTTCFINPIHGYPSDFWRYTPAALTLLCQDKAEVLYSEGWGNWYVWVLAAIGLRYYSLPIAKWHPLNIVARRNNPEVPVVTWVLARKK